MKKSNTNGSSDSSRPIRRARTPEAREDQMIALAVDLAEKQLREGTASSQVITHFLKLGSSKEKLEKEILSEQKELLKAKTNNIRAGEAADEKYAKVLEAMRRYSGINEVEDDDEE